MSEESKSKAPAESEVPDFDVNYTLDFGNFDPDEIEVDETINIVMAIDTSGSIHNYVHELNKGINDFLEKMQKSHHAPKLFVSFVTFNSADNIEKLNGFQPITAIPPQDFSQRIGGLTALYDGTKIALESALDYRDQLDKTGVETKTLLFVITDGGDNDSANGAHVVKGLIEGLMNDERSAFSFDSILFGVNQGGSSVDYEAAQKDMGIRQLAEVGTTGEDMRKMINIISASVSSSASGAGPVSVADF